MATRGWDVAQLVTASDRHATDVGSIPRCGKGFFSKSQLSVQTLLRVSVDPRVQSHTLTSERTLKTLKSMSESMESLKHQACTVGWVTLSPGKATRNSHRRNPICTIQLQKVYKKKKSKKIGSRRNIHVCQKRRSSSRQSETELTASVLKKDPKHTRD